MAPFISMRACEQVRTDICYCGLPVRFIGNGAGYSGSISGATHCAMEDCAIIGSMGNTTIIEPCDGYEAVKALEASYSVNGPVYIRVNNNSNPPVYTEEIDFEIGKALVPIKGDDGAFIVSGTVVPFAVAAAKRLMEELGVNVRVVDMHTIKPLDTEAVVSAAKTGRVIVAQDHTKIGGLGWAVASSIAEAGIACKFKILGAPDKYVPLATPPFLYKLNGYDADGLFENMKVFL
jgi:transketolase